MTLALTGHGVARGIVIGRCHLAERSELEIAEYQIEADDVAKEIQRFRRAVGAARRQLEQLAKRVDRNVGKAAAEIIETHIALLGDSSITETTETYIGERLCNAEWALQKQLETILAEFRQLADPYIRSRGEDVSQVVRLVQKSLRKQTAGKPFENIPDRLANTVVVAVELTPSELAVLHERGVAGIITEHGGPHSHTAILAGSFGIPAAMGLRRARSLLREGETLVLDGGFGTVYASPDQAIKDHFREVERDTRRFRQSLEAVRDLPSVSLDGQEISLQANAEREEEVNTAVSLGAAGIGLYRTEFLYLRGTLPDEDAQLAEYLSTIEMLGGRPLTVRTLDIGADKPNASLELSALPAAANPALGLRAVRLCLRDTDLFKTQLRAILRASAHGPVRCLIPMLTSLQEIRMVRALLEEAMEELDERGQRFDPDIPLGGMIEVPAAAMALAELGRHLDFVSVGTNDLLQYTLAADRVDEQVAHLYDPEHPGVVRLLRYVFGEAEALRLPVTVCGEIAGDRRYTRLLLALGLRSFSMHPGTLLEVKQAVRQTDILRARAALTQWLNSAGCERGRTLLQVLDESQL